MFLLILVVGVGCVAAAPLGNSMNPEVHATALVPMINGTNVPLDEKSIEAPIEDSAEVEKIRQSVHEIAENKDHPENLPVIGGFAKEHLNSTLPPELGNATGTTQSLVTGATATSSSSAPITLSTTGTPPIALSLPPVTYAPTGTPTTVSGTTPSSISTTTSEPIVSSTKQI